MFQHHANTLYIPYIWSLPTSRGFYARRTTSRNFQVLVFGNQDTCLWKQDAPIATRVGHCPQPCFNCTVAKVFASETDFTFCVYIFQYTFSAKKKVLKLFFFTFWVMLLGWFPYPLPPQKNKKSLKFFVMFRVFVGRNASIQLCWKARGLNKPTISFRELVLAANGREQKLQNYVVISKIFCFFATFGVGKWYEMIQFDYQFSFQTGGSTTNWTGMVSKRSTWCLSWMFPSMVCVQVYLCRGKCMNVPT